MKPAPAPCPTCEGWGFVAESCRCCGNSYDAPCPECVGDCVVPAKENA